ncbi:unnamed protein product [Coregonus sp. 'balchen']|nr:unnamed protein product [Coregonus sp. 'balchen']
MWKVMKQRDVMRYGTLEEFVTSCCETVPGLLTSRHQAKLALGLRTRLILELCHGMDPPDPAVILPQLERIRAPTPSSALSNAGLSISQQFSVLRDECGILMVFYHFTALYPRNDFVRNTKKDVKIETAVTNLRHLVEFPSEYGPQFDQELEKLLWEFLLRLDQLLPVPNLAQTVSWLTEAPPVLEEVQQSDQSGSKPASVSTPSPLSLTPLTNHRQTNWSSPVAPVIGGICNEDLPVMASANKRARTCQEGVIIQSVSRDVEEDAESTERSKYTWVISRVEESEEEIMRRGRRRSVRDGGSKRVLRRGRGGQFVRDGENEEEDMTSVIDGETERDLLRDCLVQLGIADLKVPEDHRIYSYIASCLLNKPRVLIPRLTSTDITALVRSQSPPSRSNGTPTAGEGSSPLGQNSCR